MNTRQGKKHATVNKLEKDAVLNHVNWDGPSQFKTMLHTKKVNQFLLEGKMTRPVIMIIIVDGDASIRIRSFRNPH